MRRRIPNIIQAISQTMNIPRAAQADVEQMTQIYSRDSILGCYEDLAKENVEKYRRTFETIASDPNQIILVADDNGIIRGSLQLTFIPYLLANSHKIALLEAISVDPDFVHQGVGSRLIAKAEQIAKIQGCRSIKLMSNQQRERRPTIFIEKMVTFRTICRSGNFFSALEIKCTFK